LFRYAASRLFGVRIDPAQPLPYKPQRNPDFRELSLEVGGRTVLNFALAYGFRNIQNLVRKMKTKRAGAIAAPSSSAAGAASSAAAASAAVTASSGSIAAPAGSSGEADDASSSLPFGSGGYHHCEVMACPSGCLNGGGQLRPPTSSTEDDTNGSGSSTLDIRAQKQLVADLDRLYHEQRQVLCEPEENPIVRRWYAEWLGGAKPYEGRAREMLHTQYHAVEKDLINPLGIKW
jgi:hypothetical protein